MNILKHKAAEYLGIKQPYMSEMIRAGRLKNYDVNHITLDSLIEYQISKRIKRDTPKKLRISTTIQSMRIEDNKLIMIFPSQKGLYAFTDKLNDYVQISLNGKKD